MGRDTKVLTTHSVATPGQHHLSHGFPGVAELTELPRFNINHQADLLSPTSPVRNHRLEQLQEEQEEQQENQLEEEEEEEEDIVSSEAFRNCSIKT